MVLMFVGMQTVAVRHLRMMGGRFVVAVLMGLVSFAMMMGRGFQMEGGFFMMIMLGHGCVSPVSTRHATPASDRGFGPAATRSQ
jgi:hypothetical protein